MNDNSAPVNSSTQVPLAPQVGYVNVPATILRRLSNLLLDRVFISITTVPFIIISLAAGDFLGVVFFILANIWFIVGYYIFFESIWQKTPAKWITKTKVVGKDGNKASFLKIFGRSLARIIPFEQLSFLFNKYPIGWHDSLSGTYVVSDVMTQEEIRGIDKEKIKQAHPSNGVGVAVIILFAFLIMIAIVGILSSVVLASLSHARDLGKDAIVRSSMSQLVPQAALYEDKNKSFVGFCTDPQVVTLLTQANSNGVTNMNSTNYVCNDSKEAWAASTNLKTGGSWCVDNTAAPTLLEKNISEGQLSCLTQ